MKYLFLFTLIAVSSQSVFAAEAIATPVVDSGLINEILGWVLGLPVIGQYGVVALTFIGAFAHLAAILPAGKEGSFWNKLRKIIIDIPVGNYLNAANKK